MRNKGRFGRNDEKFFRGGLMDFVSKFDFNSASGMPVQPPESIPGI